MIKEKTVFILGAGASYPYGYPTGFELRKEICLNFNNDYIHYYKNKKIRDDDDKIQKKITQFIKKFSDSLNSIDLFLTRNKEFEDIGKFAIVHHILKSESKSKNPSDYFDKQDWISYFYDRLTNTFIDDQYYKISDNNISIITFNYDRLLENSLFLALENSFTSVNHYKVIEEIKKLNIFHVYGKIAQLDWEDEKDGLKYKSKIDSINPLNYKDNINVIYGQRKTPNLHDAIVFIKDAKRIFFLGFGFAKENLEVLSIQDNINSMQKIYGTAYGSTKREIFKIKSFFSKTHASNKPNLIIEDCDCLTLLRNYL